MAASKGSRYLAVMRATEKLRAQQSLCKKIRVSIRTGMLNPEEAKYANGVLVELPYPTDNMRLMTKAAMEAVDRVYRPGFKYSKAEVLLVNHYLTTYFHRLTLSRMLLMRTRALILMSNPATISPRQ